MDLESDAIEIAGGALIAIEMPAAIIGDAPDP